MKFMNWFDHILITSFMMILLMFNALRSLQNDGYRINGTEIAIRNVETVLRSDIIDLCQEAGISHESITKVTMENVSKIGDKAFWEFFQLKSILIPKTVESIGIIPFYNCTNLASLTFEKGINLTRIPDSFIYYCPSIKEITFPNSVKVFGERIISQNGIENVRFEEGINFETLNRYFVCQSRKLKSLMIPKCVKFIDTYSIYSCSRLESIKFESGRTENQTLTFKIFGIASCRALQTFEFPKETVAIDLSALDRVYNLTSITFEEGSIIKEIGPLAFSIWGLKEIMIPESVENVSSSTFSRCVNMRTVRYCGHHMINTNALEDSSYVQFIHVKEDYPYSTIFGLPAMKTMNEKCEIVSNPTPFFSNSLMFSPTEKPKGNLSSPIIVIIVIASVAFVVLICFVVIFTKKRCSKKNEIIFIK